MNCVCGRSDISEIIYLSILISNIKLHPKIALQYINCYCAGGELHPSHIFVQRLIALFLIQFQLNLAHENNIFRVQQWGGCRILSLLVKWKGSVENTRSPPTPCSPDVRWLVATCAIHHCKLTASWPPHPLGGRNFDIMTSILLLHVESTWYIPALQETYYTCK